MRRALHLGLLTLCVLGLGGCTTSSEDELQQWMAEQRSKVRPRVTALIEPKQFQPQGYTQEASADPFSQQKLAQALHKDAAQTTSNGSLVAPELARRKEPLESYPLDTMTMVGSLRRDGNPVALVRLDNLLHQVRVGNYLGQNYGKVIKIDETEVTVREIVQDGGGDWIERTASLLLQERAR
jgi:type IV pilus assembly protein PilP